MLLRRVLMIVLSLALVGAVSACGNKQAKTLTAPTEGVYIDSATSSTRSRSRASSTPRTSRTASTSGASTDQLGTDDIWFAVFVRVQNESDKTQKPATTYEITDTEGNQYNPVSIDAKSNDFAYDPVPIPGKGLLPNPNAIAAQNSINGQLLLFKIPRASLDNRPLELKIHNPDESAAGREVDLDV